MGLIRGLKTVNIIYTTILGGKESSTTQFRHLSELRAYFHEHKRAGEAVGYVVIKNRTPGFKDYYLTGKLSLEWTDEIGYVCKEFDNVFKMVEFLIEQPVLGEALGYQVKV